MGNIDQGGQKYDQKFKDIGAMGIRNTQNHVKIPFWT